MLSRRGQVGETMTWIVATIIIILIVLVFFFSSNALSKIKHIGVNLDDLEVESNSLFMKTAFTYFLTGDGFLKDYVFEKVDFKKLEVIWNDK